ncbi:MAG: hypothetical protein M3Q07_08195 [Pseudobdellovibrionaceae bacterium]|nr:hypothetical protein [Pseudobdellovibrionaceae bacterium]
MADLYVHGVVIKEGGSEIRQIRSPNQSVIGIVGTAPASTELKPNVPRAYFKKKAALEAIFPSGSSGIKGSLHEAVVGIFDQLEATIVLVKSASNSDGDVIKAIESLAEAQSVTDQKPKILIAPGYGNTNPQPAANPPADPTPNPEPDPTPLSRRRS